MSRESLGHFELLVLLALLRQGDEAYGVPDRARYRGQHRASR